MAAINDVAANPENGTFATCGSDGKVPKLTDLYRDASMSTYEQDGNPANGTSANVVRRKGAVSAPKLTDFVPRCQHVNS